MCKRKSHQTDMAVMATEGANEGRTVRLDAWDSMQAGQYAEHTGGQHSGFPWWSLWLIWPLFALAKWLVPLYLGAVAAVFAQLSAAGAASFVAIVLIIAGLVMISRK